LKSKKVTLLPPWPVQPVVGPEEEDELDELDDMEDAGVEAEAEGGGDAPMSVDEELKVSSVPIG